jgi:hypothetical protein
MVSPPVLHADIYPAVDPSNFKDSQRGNVVLVIGMYIYASNSNSKGPLEESDKVSVSILPKSVLRLLRLTFAILPKPSH